MDVPNSTLINLFKLDPPWDIQQLADLLKEDVNLNEPLSSEDGRRLLHVAVTQGDVNIVRTLLDHGAYLDLPDYHGNTPSHYAAREGHVEVLQLLIDRGANVRIQNDTGRTVLENAVFNDHVGVTGLLLSKGVDLAKAESVLCSAVERGSVDVVREFLKVGMKIKNTGRFHQSCQCNSPLNIAIQTGNLKIVELFVEWFVQLQNNKENQLVGSLSIALRNRRYDIFRLLYDKGYESSKFELKHALSYALWKGNFDTVNFILDIEPDILKSPDLEQPLEHTLYMKCDSILHSAIISENIGIIELILENVGDVNTRGLDSKTPLIIAAEKALSSVVKLLLQKGADFNLCDGTGQTVLAYAVLCQKPIQIMEILIEEGASVNKVCADFYKTPLHFAAGLRNVALVEFLLEKKADLNARDRLGNTPFFTLFEETTINDPLKLISCAEILLVKGTVINFAKDYRYTKMMKFVSSFSTEIVLMFLECLFSPDKETKLTNITTEVLDDMILNGHISLLEVVFKKLVSKMEYLVHLNNDSSFELIGEEGSVSSTNEETDEIFNTTQLLRAVYVGDISLAEDALRNGVDIDTVSREGLTTLQIALYRSDFEMATYLVDQGANLNIGNMILHFLPLQIAIALGNIDLVKKLFEKERCKDVIHLFQIPILNLAAYQGNLELVNFCFEQVPRRSSKDDGGNNILHIAARIHNKELINFALENGVCANVMNKKGDTVLHTVLKAMEERNSSDLEIATILLNHKVDLNISNFDGKTVLHLATANNLTPLIGLLLEKGVEDINAMDSQGRTPFHQFILNIKEDKIVSYDPTTIVLLLVKNGADVFRDSDNLVETLRKSDVINFDIIELEVLSNSDLWRSNITHSIIKQVFCQNRFLVVQQSFNKNVTFKFTPNILDLIFDNKCTDIKKLILNNVKELNVYPSYLLKSIEHADLETVKVLLDVFDTNTIEDFDNNSVFQTAFAGYPLKYGLAQLFLDRGFNPNYALCFDKQVPIILAALDDNESMVHSLMDRGASVNIVDEEKKSPLQAAICNENVRLVKLLLSGHANVRIRGFNKSTYLHLAASKNSEITKLLLEKSADPQAKDGKGRTPLHIAAEYRNHEAAKLLIDAGAIVSVTDHNGDTPLHNAKSFQVAKLLVSEGASAMVRNYNYQTPLHCLSSHSTPVKNLEGIVDLLFESGAEIDEVDDNPWSMCSALHLAARKAQVGTLAVLLRKGAKINMKDVKGRTPLHHAVDCDMPENVGYLLDQGASPEVKDVHGLYPVHLAACNLRLLLVLCRKGVNIDSKDGNGCTALHLAIRDNNLKAVECLLRFGASTSVKNKYGHFPHQCLKLSTSVRALVSYIQALELAGLTPPEYHIRPEMTTEEKLQCLEELKNMTAEDEKGFKLTDVFSMYKRPKYLFNENTSRQLESSFQSPEFHDKFPIYASILEGFVMRGMRSRYYLARRAEVSMRSENRKKCCQLTPDLAWNHIISFLDDQDLMNVIRSEN